jgi:NitT/TauT family transport system substrate-binding protein
VKVSIQATLLELAAEQAFGEAGRYRLDPLTVTMSHPDGMAALLSGASGIDSHFTSSPFHEKEIRQPFVHTVLNSYDIVGGPFTTVAVVASGKFREDNPKIYAAFVEAFQEAIDTINKDKHAAAELYVALAKDQTPVEEIARMIEDPAVEYTMTPKRTMKIADFMARTGMIKAGPASWKDLFFPEVHRLPGS